MNLLIIFLTFFVCTISNSQPDEETKSYKAITIRAKSNGGHWIFDNNTLVTHKKNSKYVHFFDILTGKRIKKLSVGVPITKICSENANNIPDEKKAYLYVLSNINKTLEENNENKGKYACLVKIIDVAQRKIIASHILPKSNYKKIQPNSKSSLLYLLRDDNQIDIINEHTGELIENLPQDQKYKFIDPYREYGFPNNMNEDLNIFSLRTQEKIASLELGVQEIMYAINSGTLFTIGSNIIALYQLENKAIQPVGIIHNDNHFTEETISPDNYLITYDEGKHLKMWNLPNPHKPKYSIHLPFEIQSLVANKHVIAASTDKKIIILDKKQPILPLSINQKIWKKVNTAFYALIHYCIKYLIEPHLPLPEPSKPMNKQSNVVD